MTKAHEWNPQMRRGLLELSVLGLLSAEASYGYRIVTRLAQARPLAANEGTVYPLLRRLKSQGLLATYWEESGSGPPRQYYELSAAGRQRLAQLTSDWAEITLAVDQLLGGVATTKEAAG